MGKKIYSITNVALARALGSKGAERMIEAIESGDYYDGSIKTAMGKLRGKLKDDTLLPIDAKVRRYRCDFLFECIEVMMTHDEFIDTEEGEQLPIVRILAEDVDDDA